jgi:polyisoprenoid-binding protein YceI
MRRPFVIGGLVLILLLLGGAAGAYAYFFSGLRTAPKPLALASASPAASPAATAAPGGVAGTWTVDAGSVVGYRVREQFVGQSSPHEAVARTSDVTGNATVAQAANGLAASNLQFSAQVGTLKSVDTVAGYNVANRDRIVSGTLQASRFPTASFQASSISLPAGLAAGQQVAVEVPGKLTVHGVTRDATATVTIQVSGDKAQVAGSVKTDMTDFGIQPPQIGFTTVEPATTIEFQLLLSRAR